MEDALRLRELELQTNYQISTLSESLNLLKTDFHTWRDSLNEQIKGVKEEVDSLKIRTTVAIAILVAQLFGADAVIPRFLGA